MSLRSLLINNNYIISPKTIYNYNYNSMNFIIRKNQKRGYTLFFFCAEHTQDEISDFKVAL